MFGSLMGNTMSSMPPSAPRSSLTDMLATMQSQMNQGGGPRRTSIPDANSIQQVCKIICLRYRHVVSPMLDKIFCLYIFCLFSSSASSSSHATATDYTTIDRAGTDEITSTDATRPTTSPTSTQYVCQ